MPGATMSAWCLQIIDRGNDRVDLVYEVTEGAKTTVRQINSSATPFSASGSSPLSSRPRPPTMLSFLTGGDVYDPDRVDG